MMTFIHGWEGQKIVQSLQEILWQFLVKLVYTFPIQPNNPTPKYLLKKIKASSQQDLQDS